MADDQGEQKPLDVRVSELEDAVRDLTKQLSAAQGTQGGQPWPPCGPAAACQGNVPCGAVPCIAAVPCITHYVPCIAHPPCGPYPPPPPCGYRPPCGGNVPCG
jgi:hypothetical protein